MIMDDYGWLWMIMDNYGWLWMIMDDYGLFNFQATDVHICSQTVHWDFKSPINLRGIKKVMWQMGQTEVKKFDEIKSLCIQKWDAFKAKHVTWSTSHVMLCSVQCPSGNIAPSSLPAMNCLQGTEIIVKVLRAEICLGIPFSLSWISIRFT